MCVCMSTAALFGVVVINSFSVRTFYLLVPSSFSFLQKFLYQCDSTGLIEKFKWVGCLGKVYEEKR